LPILRARRPAATLRLLAAAVVLALGLAGPVTGAGAQAPPAAGGIGVRLLEAPVDAKDDPRARSYIVDHLAPGTTIERHIEVSNTSASAQAVALYAASATIKDGAFVGDSGKAANPLSTWTTVAPGSADLPAGGKATITVTMAVPDDAAPGEQYGVIWAESRSDPAAGAVTQVGRVGIRLYVSVGEGAAPAADFTIDTLTAGRTPDGKPMVSAAVHNTGGRALDLSGTLMLADGPGGLGAGPFTAEVGKTVALGATVPVAITLDSRLPAGPWKATVALESGLTKHSATASLTFPDVGMAAPVAPVPALPAESRTPAWLLPLAIGIVCVLAAGVLLVTLKRGAGGKGPDEPPREPALAGASSDRRG
jgi:hypothetical protein